jgi:phosphatidylserine/phosphatidylglycerophosphate/cardiolipin synthase-like enzyme
VAPIDFHFLQDGSQAPASVAGELVAWIEEARRSIDVAIYDFEAGEGETAKVADALEAAEARGVGVRVAFNIERIHRPAAPPPPRSQPEEIEGLEVSTRGVRGDGSLMHHKYAVRDGESVWTGSANWTEDAFGREENVIVKVDSPEVARAYKANFEQLWSKNSVERSGGQGRDARVGDSVVRPVFSPKGPSLPHLIAERLAEARHRIRILTPVLTAGPILGTLAELAARRAFDLAGAYDLTQMEEVMAQWRQVPANHWKIEAWRVIAPCLSGKRSTPYRPDSVHDYMHAKLVVAGDEVLTGSYNASRGGAENAENVLHIRDADVAQRFAAFADQVAERYRA